MAIEHHQVKSVQFFVQLEPENCTHVSQHLEQMGIALVIMPPISTVDATVTVWILVSSLSERELSGRD